MYKLLLIPVLLFNSLSFAQTGPTKAEVEKMQRDLQKQQKELQQQMDALMKDPEVRQAMERLSSGNAQFTAASMPAMPPPPPLPSTTPVRWGQLPVLNTQRLASMPKETLSAEALQAYLQDMSTRIDKSLPAAHKQSADAFIKEANGNALSISRGAVMAWYKNSPHLALALAVKSGVLAPADPEVLNTLGAILNLCGFEHRALPVLQYLNSQSPGNSTVLNNMGQSYLGLGDQKKAEEYLLMCVAQTPHHTEANKSLGMIYHAQGNMPKARECFENSLKGGYSETAFAGAGKTGKVNEPLIYEFISGRHGKTEYFNAYKYNLPPFCEKVSDAEALKKQQADFRYYLEKQTRLYESLLQEALPRQQQQTAAYYQKMTNGKVQYRSSPMLMLGARMYRYYLLKDVETAKYHNEWMAGYIKKKEQWQATRDARIKEIEAEYDKKWDQYGVELAKRAENGAQVDEELIEKETGPWKKEQCKLIDEANNTYLVQLAERQKLYVAEVIRPAQEYVQNLIYWKQFCSVGGDYETTVYNVILGYLGRVGFIAQEAEIIFPECYEGEVNEPDPKEEEAEAVKRDCPINVNLNVLIASMSLNCETFGISVNAGLSFSAEKNFITRETTLAIGAGLGTTKGGNIPLVGIEGKAGASGQFYIVFDGNNTPSDAGIKFSAGASVSTSVGAGPISTETGSMGAEAGYTLGLNSGWNFGASALGTTYQL